MKNAKLTAGYANSSFPILNFALRGSAALWRPIHWMLLTRPIRLTRFGVLYILFSLGVGAAAINTGNNLLYLILGLLLGFIVISGIFSDSCLWGIQTRWSAATDFYAGQEGELDLRLHKSWFPGVAVRIEAHWNSHPPTSHLFFWIPRRATSSARLKIRPTHRGRLELTRVRYATRFPFGLLEKFHEFKESASWVVYPAVRRIPRSVLQSPGWAFSENSFPRKGTGTSPLNLREYRAGDSSRQIHWKSSAKLQSLMVMEMEDDSQAGHLLIVPHWLSGEEGERLVEFVASLVFTFFTQDQRIGLYCPRASFAPDHSRVHLKKILTYLALLDLEEERGHSLTSSPVPPPCLDALELFRRASNGGHQ
jgi:uncharacterized protein (DUF58 family)